MNERHNPHMVELAVPQYGFGPTLSTMHDWHREHGMASKQGASWRDSAGDHVRWSFADPEIANAFAKRFGGRRLTAEKRFR